MAGSSSAQLAIGVASPGPEGTIPFQGKGVLPASGNRHPVPVFPNLYEGDGVVPSAVSQLTVLALAAAPQSTVYLEEYGVISSGGHIQPYVVAAYENRGAAVCPAAVCKLAAPVGAPTPHGAIIADHEDVGGPRGNRRPNLQGRVLRCTLSPTGTGQDQHPEDSGQNRLDETVYCHDTRIYHVGVVLFPDGGDLVIGNQ